MHAQQYELGATFTLEAFSDEEEQELLPLLEDGLQTLFSSVDGACVVKELHHQGIHAVEAESRRPWDTLLASFYLGRDITNSASSKQVL